LRAGPEFAAVLWPFNAAMGERPGGVILPDEKYLDLSYEK